MKEYNIPDSVFKKIAASEDLDELATLKRRYRNARYAPDARLAIDDRIQYLRLQAANE